MIGGGLIGYIQYYMIKKLHDHAKYDDFDMIPHKIVCSGYKWRLK